MKISELKNPFILVDGSSYLFRAYYALPTLTNSKNQPTGAIYGVLNMLRRLLKTYSPTHMAVVFDSKEPTFRKQLYPAYKANRSTMPEELQVQLEPLKSAITTLGLPLIIMPGVEADDIIATLAQQAVKDGFSVLISTGDKDLTQIVNDHITLLNTMNDTVLDVAGVKQKFGVSPEQMVDYLTLIGDSSDNIPGIPGVGPKTAVKWLTEYKTLDQLIKHAGHIGGKVGENLRQHLIHLPLAQQLIHIQLDVPLLYSPLELAIQSVKSDELYTLLKELEFKNWLNEINSEQTNQLQSSPKTSSHCKIINNLVELNTWIEDSKTAPHIAITTLLSNPNPLHPDTQLVGIAFAYHPNEAIYIPIINEKECLLALQTIFSIQDKIIIGHNLKIVLEILSRKGLNIYNQLWDSMLAAYILDSTATHYDLANIVFQYLEEKIRTSEDVLGKGSKQLSFKTIQLAEAADYATECVLATLKLFLILSKKIAQNPELEHILRTIDLALLPVLSRIELHGVLLNQEMLKQQSQELQIISDQVQNRIYALSGEDFNLNSPKQLQTILFDKLQLPSSQKTPTGQPSTAENVLQELAESYEIAQLILQHRNLMKLKSTYTDKLPLQINRQTNRIHTCYQQTGTITGRLSSKDPNLQNIPIRSAEGRKIRQAFIAPPHSKIISADYSQVELRLMAHLSQDPGLLAAFTTEQDIHQATAAEVFNIPLTDVTSNQRRSAKAINFGLIYGMSSFGLSQQLNISRQKAQEYIEMYFHRYPKVKEYLENARQLATQQGYVKTLAGRRIIVTDINSNNIQRRLAAERAAINAPLQGSAADIIKLAMVAIDREFMLQKIQGHMIMQVHDELVFEVKEEAIPQALNIIKDHMENVVHLTIPLLVHIEIGDNWDEAH